MKSISDSMQCIFSMSLFKFLETRRKPNLSNDMSHPDVLYYIIKSSTKSNTTYIIIHI